MVRPLKPNKRADVIINAGQERAGIDDKLPGPDREACMEP